MAKIDNVEKDRRLRIIQEWLIDDWPAADIKVQIVEKWGVSVRQAERYIEDARVRWNKDEDEKLDRRRRKMVETLKKRKRNMKPEFIGTPAGMNALLRIDKEISRLENLYPSEKDKTENVDGFEITIE